MQETIEKAERNIRQALEDYGAHTDEVRVLDDISDDFITRLAKDSVEAKWELRQLFRKSPVWCEDIDALVINGTRTHDPDYNRVRDLAVEILAPARERAYAMDDSQLYDDIERAICFFANENPARKDEYISAITRLAPKAYAPGKKLSRVFKAICVKLGVADETAGSEFQHFYAQFADELSARKISFKLYVSINPAHFLTMSNPKWDDRGPCLTSCHSFNSTEYSYNNGCSGYARDNYTFIVFTVDDPAKLETLNNRKTTRQIFVYKPGNGVLLQSRMYNTAGGVYGAAEDSKLYRDLVQREISMLESAPNLWRTGKYLSEEYRDCVTTGYGFGGYPDWTYENFDAHVSVRVDHIDDWKPLTVGTYGLCICCGEETSEGLYCEDCKQGEYFCDHCEEYTNDELTTVHNGRGNEIHVCQSCLESYYSYCDVCGEYYPRDDVECIDGCSVCSDCRDEYYRECDYCGEYHKCEDMILVHDRYGDEAYVCNEEYCLSHYPECEDCEERYYEDAMCVVYLADGTTKDVCENCAYEYAVCPECGERIEICDDETCSHCGAMILKEGEAA